MTTIARFVLVPASGRHSSKKNTLIASRGKVRNASHTKAAQLDLHRQASAICGDTPFFSDVPYRLDLTFAFPTADESLWWGPYMGTPDTLNMAALVHDALEGVLYADDKQICRNTEKKVWGPRCEIIVWMTEWET